jgi:hypothetical protein
MNKIIYRCILFVIAMVFFCTQPAFAQFKIAIVNDSKVIFKEVFLIISAEGFDAASGEIALDTKEILPGVCKEFICPYKYLEIPMTGTFIPRKNCDLNISIMAIPKFRSRGIEIQELYVNKMLNQLRKNQETILEDEPYQFGIPLSGIKPPDMLITLTDYGIEFSELKTLGSEANIGSI